MKITIDNLDGAGALDYTAALSAASPLKITRTLGELARCVGALDLNGAMSGMVGALTVPVRAARVAVTDDAGAVLFTGALTNAPERIFAGVGTMGAMHTLAFAALADAEVSHSVADGSAVKHTFTDGDGVLHIAAPASAAARELATDVTLSGEVEPAAYITEYFLGDGTTETFQLAKAPFVPAGGPVLLEEPFDQAALDAKVWRVRDTGSFLAITSAGLTMTGGNGFDGQTTVAAVAPVEMGGTLIVTVRGVQLGAASDGVVCGLYSNAVERSRCLAGFNVRQSGGATVVTPLVNGAETGTSLTMLSGHRYTLRLRLHCPETVRRAATYTAITDGDLRSFGGGTVAAPLTMVFEAQDLGLSSNTPAIVLHAGQVADSPASCVFAPVNSVQLIGSIAGCGMEQAGSAWVVTTASDGSSTVRMSGDAGDGVDCMISTAGRITFFSGRVPLPNELITVSYRGRRRAVARLGDGAGRMWQGRVAHPAPRTSEDCENAALATLGFAGSRAAALAGTYTVVNPVEDIAPGDVLAIASQAGAASDATDTLRLIVRTVTIEDGHSQPETHTYRIGFANDWATSLNMRPGGALADDALVPVVSAMPLPVLANLSSLAVVSATETALTVDAGVEPPAGGGFEVRRRDWAFGPGTDPDPVLRADLVLRSPVRSFSIPRMAQVERYFVRMYGGSSVPVYSRLSSAVFTNLPVG